MHRMILTTSALVLLTALAGCAISPSGSQIEQMSCGDLEKSYRSWGTYYIHGQDETRDKLRRRFLAECCQWPKHIRDYVAQNQIREGID